MAQNHAAKFGIGEWYGRSFAALTAAERLELAAFKPDQGSRLKKHERTRLAVLSQRANDGLPLKPREQARLLELQQKKAAEAAGNQPCPFKALSDDPICTKTGGVCSLRLYEANATALTPAVGERGALRAVCPYRFHEGRTVFEWAGETLLGTPAPSLVSEVGFLESSSTVDGAEGEDVGRIDMVLVNPDLPSGHPMHWAALEIQAVYFSGDGMPDEFNDILAKQGNVVSPKDSRRPDYRSSGPKRLMPQLQIKVPTLRRWGKKMAVVVDRSFFESIGEMKPVTDISNSDIVWLVVDFAEVSGERRFQLVPGFHALTTLERSIEGLTGGTPVSMSEFEKRIAAKFGSVVDDAAVAGV